MNKDHTQADVSGIGEQMSNGLPSYTPQPIDTSDVKLSLEILELTERLAEHAHEVWARQRLLDGWTLGPRRNDAMKQHPCLIPYADLPDGEKQYDRNAALDTLKAIMALGYEIRRNG
jgi:hypothetical protein